MLASCAAFSVEWPSREESLGVSLAGRRRASLAPGLQLTTDWLNRALAGPLKRRVLLSAAVFAAADLPKPINCRTAVSSSLDVSGLSVGVGAVTVALDAEDARDADVQVELVSPAGTRVLL